MKTVANVLLVFTIFQSVYATNCQPDGTNGELAKNLDVFLTDISGKGFSGAVLVAKDDKIVLQKGYGLADREQKIRNTPETLFNVASIAKVFTAAAILQLEEKGKLKTGDRINKYLGKFPKEKNEATIHQLLTHTSGLVVKGASLDYNSRKSFIQSVKDTPMASKPGEKFQYLNAGYSLLAAIVEEASGLKFEYYLQQHIFKPAGMNSTGYAWDARFDKAPVAIGYRGKTLRDLRPEPRESDVWSNRGPEGLLTSVGDLYKWIQALDKNSVISKPAKKKMFTAYFGDEGYGWHVKRTDQNQRLVHRGGGLPAFESEMRWYLDDDVVVIFTINNHLGFRVPVIKGIEQLIEEGKINAPRATNGSSGLPNVMQQKIQKAKLPNKEIISQDILGVGDKSLRTSNIKPGYEHFVMFTTKDGINQPVSMLTREIILETKNGEDMIVVKQTYESASGVNTDTSVFFRQTLAPVSYGSEMTNQTEKFEFTPTEVKGTATANDGKIKETKIALENPIFNAVALDEVLKSLPLKSGYKTSFRVYNPGKQFLNITLHVSGSEQISLANGTKLDVWILDLEGTAVPSKIWITKNGQKLIKKRADIPNGSKFWQVKLYDGTIISEDKLNSDEEQNN